jgi:hypothetical protein
MDLISFWEVIEKIAEDSYIVTLPIPKVFLIKYSTDASSICNFIKNLKAKVLLGLTNKNQPSASVKPLYHSINSLEKINWWFSEFEFSIVLQ